MYLRTIQQSFGYCVTSGVLGASFAGAPVQVILGDTFMRNLHIEFNREGKVFTFRSPAAACGEKLSGISEAVPFHFADLGPCPFPLKFIILIAVLGSLGAILLVTTVVCVAKRRKRSQYHAINQ